jgi:hypothetical protein
MICAVCIAVVGALGLVGWAFIAVLAFALSRLDRRRYVRQLHRMRQASTQ